MRQTEHQRTSKHNPVGIQGHTQETASKSNPEIDYSVKNGKGHTQKYYEISNGLAGVNEYEQPLLNLLICI